MNASGSRKIAVVTGGSRGIGRAIAQRLAQDGFDVVLSYVSQEQQAEQLAEKLRHLNVRALAVRSNVASETDVSHLFDKTLGELGRPHVVVNSAAIFDILPFAEMDKQRLDAIIDVNIKGTVNVLRRAAQDVVDGGRIIALSSSVIAFLNPGYGPYAASKAAVEILARTLAHELRGRNICVNALAPGATATEMFLAGKTEAQIERNIKLSPLERLGTPEDIAKAVSFLAGPDGAWVNAQVVRVNGGTI